MDICIVWHGNKKPNGDFIEEVILVPTHRASTLDKRLDAYNTMIWSNFIYSTDKGCATKCRFMHPPPASFEAIDQYVLRCHSSVYVVFMEAMLKERAKGTVK